MSSMPWVKLYTDFLDDHKIGRLPDLFKLRFVQILLLAGDCDAEGYLTDNSGPLEMVDIAYRLHLPNEDGLLEQLQELQKAKLVNYDPKCKAWCVTNFSKRQGRSQSVKRDQWRKAQQKKRSVIPDNDPNHTSVIDESSMTHAPREEVEEESEEEIRGEDAAPDLEKPARKEINTMRGNLARKFLSLTHLAVPKTDKTHIKTTQKLWWTPLEDMLCEGGWQYALAEEVLTMTVDRMLKDGLTISDPNSILKTFRAILAEKNRNGNERHYSEVY